MKLRLLVVLIFLMVVNKKSIAQYHSGTSYKYALGVKFYPGAITYKYNINNSKSLEAIDYFWRGNRITGLLEMHYDIGELDGFRWFVGPGAHFSQYDKNNNGGRILMGLDGIIGFDWKINNAPLNLQLDWQPSFEFAGDYMFIGDWLCLSIRYVF